MTSFRDPILHTGATDKLPDDHPRAWDRITCDSCGEDLHAFNNECMQIWVETAKGNFCLLDYQREVMQPEYHCENYGFKE